jgi:CRP/FNR family cyclic AMP-dependent transcriptional regulator
MGQTSVDALRGLQFFENMDASHVNRLVAMGREVGFEKDQVIFREGEAARQFYIVLTGKVALELTTSRGRSRVLTVEGGHELGWSFLVPETGRHFRAKALEQVRTLVFDGGELSKACEQDALFGQRLTKRLLRNVTGRLEATVVQLHDSQGS